MGAILVETLEVANIPVLSIAPATAVAAPVVIFMHGFTGQKEHGLEIGYQLAQAGFACIAFDAISHGMRDDGRIAALADGANNIYPAASGLDMYLFMHQAIVQSAQDVQVLSRALAGDKRFDFSRLGVTGVSMGGFASFYLAANSEIVRAAAPVIGIPAFSRRWEDVLLESSTYVDWRSQLATAVEQSRMHSAWMREIDPFHGLAAYAPRPLFMLSGDLDTDSPKVYSVQLLRELAPVYAAAPDRLRLKIYDGARHEFTSAMRADLVEWFQRYL
ncbi:MAG: dienelactone hydrolase family protein [Anaerolineales bacterium]|nr:dienelactone hydrolase family protein [Anaerolineales bacterium]